MITLFLKFPDKATALAAFTHVTGQPVEDVSEVPSKTEVNGMLCDVDVIGDVLDGDVPVDGYHVNVWVLDDAVVPELLEPFRVFPETPSRVFG